jgi:hypothetical protein
MIRNVCASYPGMRMNGCDSMAELNVTLATIDAFVEMACKMGICSVPLIQILSFSTDIDWEGIKGCLVSTDIIITR